MLTVAIIASGTDYQAAAALTAATFARHVPVPAGVSVWLPEGEFQQDGLAIAGMKHGFVMRHFPFRQVSDQKFTSQLKCQAFVAAVARTQPDDLLFIVDADTCCLQPLAVPEAIAQAVLGGKLALAPDIEDRHFPSPEDPWYLPPEGRLPYVNSGVILTGRRALDLFVEFRDLSEQPRFLHGPFNDQKVINYALGKSHRHRFVALPAEYNAILPHPQPLITHFAGGAGELGRPGNSRKETHRQLCHRVLQRPAPVN